MNARIRTLVAAAEAELSAPEQERLADLVQAFLDARGADGGFTDSELAHLRLVDREPFEAADPEAVAAYFGRRA
jgi:hypothetical protein